MLFNLPSFGLRAVVALSVAAAATGAAHAQTVPRRYVVKTELTPPANAPSAQGWALNEQGLVVGGGSVIDGTTTKLVFIGGKFSWVKVNLEHSGGITWAGGQSALLKPFISKASSDPADVNDTGWVVGRAAKSSAIGAKLYATLWKTASPTDLGAGTDSQAEFINQQGWVLGTRFVTINTKSTTEPFLWRNGKLERLNTYPSGVIGMVCRGLSDSGLAPCTGTTYDPAIYGTNYLPYVWSNGIYQALSYPGAQGLAVAGISRSGLVSGNLTLDGQLRAFVWNNGLFTLLPQTGYKVLAPTTQGLLRAYRTVDRTEPPYVQETQQQLWSLSGDAVDVRDLVVASGETVVTVFDINNQGQLVATVRRATDAADSTGRSVVLSPVAP